MSKFTNPLSNIKIASPCSADWNGMIGNERRRFCGDCKLNVYNLSEMSQTEAENLLLNSEGRLCVRFYRRADGTILTKDCPVGWKALKQRVSKTATAFVSLVFAESSEHYITGQTAHKIENPIFGETFNENSNTAIQKPILTMGNVASPNDYTLNAGGMTNLDAVRFQIKKRRKR